MECKLKDIFYSLDHLQTSKDPANLEDRVHFDTCN